MNVEPDKKKARSTKDAPSNMPVGGIHFTPELIARVATFVEAVSTNDLPSDVKKICHAVGPMPSRIIKQVYLNKNMRYLEKVIQAFYGIIGGMEWAREWASECHRAWMSVNTGWRSLVTDELIERHGFPSNHQMITNLYHPLSAMTNPAVAIEMHLLDALKYLVEVKGIDVNARWYLLGQLPPNIHFHLVATAIGEENYDAFQYLMSADAIDIYSLRRHFPFNSLRRETIFSYAIDVYIEDESKKRYFDSFVKHAKFQANARLFGGYDPESDEDTGELVTCLHYLLMKLVMQYYGRYSEEVSERITNAIKYVLDAGADPELGFGDLSSPLAVAIGYFTAHDDGDWLIKDALSEIVRMMQEKSESR